MTSTEVELTGISTSLEHVCKCVGLSLYVCVAYRQVVEIIINSLNNWSPLRLILSVKSSLYREVEILRKLSSKEVSPYISSLDTSLSMRISFKLSIKKKTTSP